MSRLLDHINNPHDLRRLKSHELPKVAQELREFIIDIVATKEGHLGASLGVVELTIALHFVFKTPDDLLIWDVGHQAYGHKILTGRKAVFHTNRQLNGISGFPKRSESVYDTFGVGHSSTSISAALGMAIASQLSGDFERQHVAVIGDASIASGMAFEGLNHAGTTSANLLVILNDNAIGIDPSVGALKDYLTRAKIGKKPKQDNIIEALNFTYHGPIDGHDLPELLKTLKHLKTLKGPQFLHVITTKGKGLKQAEENQVKYHAPGKFDKFTGELPKASNENMPPKFQDVFGLTLVELASNNKKIIGVTPAMPTGSSLKYMMDVYPNRAFDVGIAEQHAVTFSAGMVTQGFTVFCNIYSTFLQRAYDQVIHDVALQDLPVIFCIDRSGLVGQDGATHHGVFDIAYLRSIPNLMLCSPRNEFMLRNILFTASNGLKHPIAIRYPRGRGEIIDWQKPFKNVEIGKGYELKKGNRIAILTVGPFSENVSTAIKHLSIVNQKKVGHYDMCFIKPLDVSLLENILKDYEYIITIEDGVAIGGFGSAVLEFSNTLKKPRKVRIMGIPDAFIHHGTIQELESIAGISTDSILKEIKSFL